MSVYAKIKVIPHNKNMKKKIPTRLTSSASRRQPVRQKLAALFFVAVLVAGGVTFGAQNFAQADSLQQQIDQLAAENAANEQAVTDLANQAVSYQDAIQRLQSQLTVLRGQIADNQAKQAALQEQIRLKQIELEQQRAFLAENLKAIYVKDRMSTVEMLATSKSLSDFVDAETYRGSVQAKIQRTLADITRLQTQLSEQKLQVERLLADQRKQEADQVAIKAEQDRLLALNLNQQAEFNQRTAANQARINELVAEQARLNDPGIVADFYFLRFPGPVNAFNPDDYPFKNAGFSMSTAPGCVDNDGPDPWGYCTRQCVSYTAWAVKASGRSAPMYYGNAKDWVVAARRQGVPVYTSNPRPGDIAISTAGTWGHAMYVEKANGNQVLVSQYNAQLTGRFSTQWRTFR